MSPALTIHAAVPERHVQVDIEVPAGRVLAVLGANGAGKSTVLALAAGLVRPERGTVTIGGHEVAGGRWVPPHRRKIALLAQEPLLLPHLDVLANVAFGPRAAGLGRRQAGETARARLREVGADHLARRRPRKLSGGQQQRVALARALAPDPQLLLLDEPLAALDVQAAADLRQLLRTSVRATGRTAVIVTHDLLDVLALADDVVVLDGGRVAEQGPSTQLLSQPRTDFTARFAGVNLLIGTRLAADALRIGADAVMHGLSEGPGSSGSAAAATFSPRAVAVHRTEPGGSPRNTITVRVVGIEQQGELVRVRGKNDDGAQLAADITPASVAGLDLALGDTVAFVIKAAEVRIYPA